MSITLKAYAKINLALEVLGKRDDGYHEIKTVLQTIDLSDTLTFESSDQLNLRCTVPELETEDNLVLRAARLLKEASGYPQGASITLEKCIPVAAGLGSASSDAASTLVGLNNLWGLGLPLSALEPLGAGLGSDVTFFLRGGTALATGRGEHIKPLPSPPEFWIVLVKPPVQPPPGKTAKLYSLLTSCHYSAGDRASNIAETLVRRQALDFAMLYNVFEQVAFDYFPGLKDAYSLLSEAGAANICLAGSGPALFAPTGTRLQAHNIFASLQQHGQEVHLAKIMGASNTHLSPARNAQ